MASTGQVCFYHVAHTKLQQSASLVAPRHRTLAVAVRCRQGGGAARAGGSGAPHAADADDLARQKQELEEYMEERNRKCGSDTQSRRRSRKTAGLGAIVGDSKHKEQHALVYTTTDTGKLKADPGRLGGGEPRWWALWVSERLGKRISEWLTVEVPGLPPLEADGGKPRFAETWIPSKKIRAWNARTKKMGYKTVKYGEGGWLLLRAVMDERLDTLLRESPAIKGYHFTQTAISTMSADLKAHRRRDTIPQPCSDEFIQEIKDWIELEEDEEEEAAKLALYGDTGGAIEGKSERIDDDLRYVDEYDAQLGAYKPDQGSRPQRYRSYKSDAYSGTFTNPSRWYNGEEGSEEQQQRQRRDGRPAGRNDQLQQGHQRGSQQQQRPRGGDATNPLDMGSGFAQAAGGSDDWESAWSDAWSYGVDAGAMPASGGNTSRDAAAEPRALFGEELDVDELLKDFRTDFLGEGDAGGSSSTGTASGTASEAAVGTNADDWLSFFAPEIGGPADKAAAGSSSSSSSSPGGVHQRPGDLRTGNDDGVGHSDDDWLSIFEDVSDVANTSSSSRGRGMPNSSSSLSPKQSRSSSSDEFGDVDDWLGDLLQEEQQQRGGSRGASSEGVVELAPEEGSMPLWAWDDGDSESQANAGGVTWKTERGQGSK